MMYFAEPELKALNDLPFDEQAVPYFDALRDCLRWFDEAPPSACGSAYEHVIDLVIVRGFIHQGRKREEWYVLSPTTYFSEVWDEALKGAPNWPGFRRLGLSEADKSYLDQERSKPLEEHIS